MKNKNIKFILSAVFFSITLNCIYANAVQKNQNNEYDNNKKIDIVDEKKNSEIDEQKIIKKINKLTDYIKNLHKKFLEKYNNEENIPEQKRNAYKNVENFIENYYNEEYSKMIKNNKESSAKKIKEEYEKMLQNIPKLPPKIKTNEYDNNKKIDIVDEKKNSEKMLQNIKKLKPNIKVADERKQEKRKIQLTNLLNNRELYDILKNRIYTIKLRIKDLKKENLEQERINKKIKDKYNKVMQDVEKDQEEYDEKELKDKINRYTEEKNKINEDYEVVITKYYPEIENMKKENTNILDQNIGANNKLITVNNSGEIIKLKERIRSIKQNIDKNLNTKELKNKNERLESKIEKARKEYKQLKKTEDEYIEKKEQIDEEIKKNDHIINKIKEIEKNRYKKEKKGINKDGKIIYGFNNIDKLRIAIEKLKKEIEDGREYIKTVKNEHDHINQKHTIIKTKYEKLIEKEKKYKNIEKELNIKRIKN